MSKRLVLTLLALLIVSSLAVWAAAPAGDIGMVASKDKDLTTFVAAVKAAGLTDALAGKGPFTVFAPNNAAFRTLPRGALANLLKPANKEKLKSILLYHVVKGHYMAADVVKAKKPVMLTSLEGSKLVVVAKGKSVMVNKAKVTKADVMASNGVIHEIDMVLMPMPKK